MSLIRPMLAENAHALIVLIGFGVFEAGLVVAISGACAAIVGGAIVMLVGSWRYVGRPMVS